MKGLFFRLLITALGLWAATTIVPGVPITGGGTPIVAALLLGLVNGISLSLVAWVLPGFTLSGLGAAILGSVVVGLTSWVASAFVGSSGRIEHIRRVEVPGRRVD